EAFEFVTEEAPYRIRAIRVGDKVAILATPGQCPQVTAVDHCVEHRLKTDISVHGTAPCLGPLTVPSDKLTTAMGNNEYSQDAIVDRVRLLVTQQVRAEPHPQTLFEIALYLRLIEPLTSERLDVSALEDKYGPLLHQPGYTDPKVQGSYMVILPNSQYTRKL